MSVVHPGRMGKETAITSPLLKKSNLLPITDSGAGSPHGLGPRVTKWCLGKLGMQSVEEMRKVITFLVAAFLANSFFVIGRNIGTVLFLAAVGDRYLTTAIFLSGTATVFAGQLFSSLSRGRSTTLVNGWMLIAAVVTLSAIYLVAVSLPRRTSEAAPGLEFAAVFVLYFSVYIAQDVFTNFVCMQCASVAQSAFSVTDAKRLFGMVQMGNSLAAMAIGVTIGSIAKVVGTDRLLLVQVAVLLLSMLLNARIGRLYVDAGVKKQKKGAKTLATGGAPEAEPWWQNLLILAMALWGFTVIFTKTMYEYEYNVLVAGVLSPAEMVTLTGYLYAGAGLCSTAINLFGTSLCLDQMGMRGAILATPAALLSVSLAILVAPSVKTTFLGRLVDLSLRWSLNNTVRTVLWIAVPAQQAATAKPWVEGTIKKMGQAFNAVVISVVLLISGGNLGSLSFLSLAFSSLLFACCVRVYRLYLDSMLTRIKRRELKHQILQNLPNDENISSVFQEKLMHGGTVAQLDTLMQVGEGLSNEDWQDFFSRFHELPSAVQLKVVELGRRQRFRIDDDFLLDLIAGSRAEPAVLESAIVAVGDRRLCEALEPLEAHLDSSLPSLRAATAVSILRIGWGVGLGAVSSAALLVLEAMLDFALAGNVGASGKQTGQPARNAAHAILAQRGRRMGGEATVEELEELEDQLTSEWEAALDAGYLGQGAALALQLTHVKTTLRKLRKKKVAEVTDSPGLSRQRSPSVRPRSTNSMTEVMQQKEEELAVALQMVQLLPEPRTLVPFDTWLDLLQHRSHKVRWAALGFVQPDDVQHPQVLKSLVASLESSRTYSAAEAALHVINRPVRVQEAVLQQLTQCVEKHKEDVKRLGAHLEEDEPSSALTLKMLQLLKFLKRQTAWAGAELQLLQASDLCDRLLTCSAELLDTDVLLELYQTAIDLKDQGFAVTCELAETRLRIVAIEMCKGLAVEKWLGQYFSRMSHSQRLHLRTSLQLQTSADNRGKEDGEGTAVEDLMRIALAYTSEQVYLSRLQLLQLAFLAAPRTPSEYGSTRVLAAWRLLRDHNEKSEVAVLELLDSILPLTLKSIVVHLLERSPIEKKLAVGTSLYPGLTEALDSSAAEHPAWIEQWFRSSGSVLGVQLAETLLPGAKQQTGHLSTLLPKMVLLSKLELYRGLLSLHLAEIAVVASVLHFEEGPCPTAQDETYFVVDGTFQSKRGQVRSGGAIQAYNVICKELENVKVECVSPKGGTMLCIKRRSLFDLMVRLSPKFALGLLKSMVKTLPAPGQIGGKRVAEESKPGTRLRFSTADDIPLPSAGGGAGQPPPLHLGLESEQTEQFETGADVALLVQQMEQEGSSLPNESENVKSPHSEETLAVEENGFILPENMPTGQARESFSLLEKVLLLQGVKMFRHVPDEFLPSLAMCCTPCFQPRNSIICRQGDPSDATLFIVADGAVGLFKDGWGKNAAPGNPPSYKKSKTRLQLLLAGQEETDLGSLVRKLLASDTMGNTALLCDTDWSYSALAMQDTWLLCLNRRDLTDALRGRRELASAVIRGLYKTFTRRIQLLESNNELVRVDTCALVGRG